MCLILVKRCQMNTENSVSDKHCTIWRTNAKECNIVQHSTNQTCTNVVDMKRYRLFNDDIDYSINANNETSHSQETKWFLKNEVACTKISDFTRWSKNSCVLL